MAAARCDLGIGMLTKYTMLFCVAGIVIGVVATPLRRHLASKWLWVGAALSVLIFLPNVIWQAQHHFISLEFLRHIHARDVRIGRTKDFLPDQLTINLLGLPLALAGLGYYFFAPNEKQWRALGWLYVVPFILFFVLQGRGYYLAPAYPLLFAGGAVWLEKTVSRWQPRFRHLTYVTAGLALFAGVAVAGAVVLPIAPIHSRWWNFAVANNGDLVEEIGWPELIETVARVRDRLPPADRERLGSPGRQLRRSRSTQPLWTAAQSAAGDQRHEFLLVARLRESASRSCHRRRLRPGVRGLLLPVWRVSGAHVKSRRRYE